VGRKRTGFFRWRRVEHAWQLQRRNSLLNLKDK
jgi:hypothetical protein